MLVKKIIFTFLAAILWIKLKGGHAGQFNFGAHSQSKFLGKTNKPLQGWHFTSLAQGQLGIITTLL
jgi:hypothetical protein